MPEQIIEYARERIEHDLMSAVFAPSSPDWSDGQIKARIEALNRIDAAWRSISRQMMDDLRARMDGSTSLLTWWDTPAGRDARARQDESTLLCSELQQEWALFTRGLGQARVDAYCHHGAASLRWDGWRRLMVLPLDDVTIRGATMVAGVDF